MRFQSENANYTNDYIESSYLYQTSNVVLKQSSGGEAVYSIKPTDTRIKFHTERKVPKTGVMMVGWGGNNGTTLTGVIVANRENICWNTKKGPACPNYYGSLVLSSTMCVGAMTVGSTTASQRIYAPICSLLPFLNPNELEIDGWDINDMGVDDAMARAQVFDYDLQEKLRPFLTTMKPRPSVYNPDYIAANQKDRANNVIQGNLKTQLETIRNDIRDFKSKKNLSKVIVLWTASTERYAKLTQGVHDTADGILKAVETNHPDISPSTLFAVASILEGCSFINGSPQNTIHKGIIELAERHHVHLAGDDFKTGQTKLKSSLVEFLLGSGIKPVSIVSYNHLGNNDGKNLDAYEQFRSKEISKSGLIDEMIDSNQVLYKKNEKPDHSIVIKYVPYVGDSKRALDEYTSEICMGGNNTLVIHNTCEDSLLASTVMLDLILLCEFFQRVVIQEDKEGAFVQHSPTVLSYLGFLLKAPLTSESEPKINGFHAQKACLENLVRACLGLPAENHMYLERKYDLKNISLH